MAPDPRLAPGGWDEVREAVAALHRAGIEVILDVVFNHTGEGDEFGPTSVAARPGQREPIIDCARTRRAITSTTPAAAIFSRWTARRSLRLALDALRAWAEFGGVDGFRFDLATTLARRAEGFDAHAPFLSALLQDPVLRELKLIAEPWDIGPGGYQLGKFPGPFAEWNDRFRDCVARFWRGDDIGVGELATRVAGSRDLFEARRRPSSSVNFVTAHDGFTLRDLVSYSHKRNAANGEDNRDGTNDNFSWNNGVEGETDDDAILAARGKDQRNLLASLLLARGTPMLSMGAELGQTQAGNNNAYAQDNETAWLDWSGADRELLAFTRGPDRAAQGLSRADARQLSAGRAARRDAHSRHRMAPRRWRAHARGRLARRFRDDAARLSLCADGRRARRRSRRHYLAQRGGGRDRHAAAAARRFRLDAFASRRRRPSLLQTASRSPRARSSSCANKPRPKAVDSTGKRRPNSSSRWRKRRAWRRSWRDVDGAEHAVPRETIEALLAALHLPANSLSQARESLALLARREDSRALPMSAAFRDDEDIFLRLPVRDGRAATRLELDARRRRAARCRSSRGRFGDRSPGAAWTAESSRACARACRACRSDDTSSRWRGPIAASPSRRAAATRRESTGAPSASRRSSIRCGATATRASAISRLSSQLGALAAAHGAAIVAINPLHALFARDRERASPYYPSDRRFLDPIYLDIVRGGDFFNAPNTGRLVDYPAVHALKQEFLERAFRDFEHFAQAQPGARTSQDFESFIAEGGDALVSLRLFRGDQRAARRRRLAALARAAARRRTARAGRLRARKRQPHPLSSISAMAVRKPVRAGGASGGERRPRARLLPRSRRWRGARRLRELARRGASSSRAFRSARRPMRFTRDGQNWGLPPPDPLRWKADGCAELWRALAREHAPRRRAAHRSRHGSGAALRRAGRRQAAGGRLSILSAGRSARRARARNPIAPNAWSIGEDLGTLPWGFSERLADGGMLSYRVLWFEREGEGFAPPAHYARMAMACVSTHDLPTLKGWWEGADIAEKLALGLLSEEDARKERETRREDRRLLLEALAREGLLRGARKTSIPTRPSATLSPAPRMPMWRARRRCWRWRKSTISPAKRSRSICREPTGSARTGGASSTRKRRFCSKAVWRKRF